MSRSGRSRAPLGLARSELAADAHRSDALRPMQPVGFDRLAGFAEDDALAAFRVFRGVGAALIAGRRRRCAPPCPRRPRCSPPRARRSAPTSRRGGGAGVLRRAFRAAPDRARLSHRLLRALGRGRADAVARIRRAAAGASRADLAATRSPYPARAEIEAGARAIPSSGSSDAVEAYLIQVQGSARVRLRDGSWRRLVYDGRNGRPYTSIGRLLIEAGEIARSRDVAGAAQGVAARERHRRAAARALMRRNESYVFFRLAEDRRRRADRRRRRAADAAALARGRPDVVELRPAVLPGRRPCPGATSAPSRSRG